MFLRLFKSFLNGDVNFNHDLQPKNIRKLNKIYFIYVGYVGLNEEMGDHQISSTGRILSKLTKRKKIGDWIH